MIATCWKIVDTQAAYKVEEETALKDAIHDKKLQQLPVDDSLLLPAELPMQELPHILLLVPFY